MDLKKFSKRLEWEEDKKVYIILYERVNRRIRKNNRRRKWIHIGVIRHILIIGIALRKNRSKEEKNGI